MKKYPLYNNVPLYANFRELLADVARKYGENTAYTYRVRPSDETPTKISFTQLAEDVRALSTAILSRGFGGAHVALIGKLTYPWLCTYYSLLAVGAVVVPLDAEWGDEDLAETVARADCTGLFYSEEIRKNKLECICRNGKFALQIGLDETEGEESFVSLMEQGRALREAGDTGYEEARVNPDALAMLAFTSGTTGKGKGVMLTQTGILSNVWGSLQLLEIKNRTIAVLPPHHTFGSNLNIVAHLVCGADMYLSSGIRYLLREMKEHKPTQIALVPLFLESFQRKIVEGIREKKLEKDFARLVKVSNAMRKTGVDMRRKLFKGILTTFGGELDLVVSGGAPLNQTLVDFFDAIGITVINGYGITECSPVLAANRNHARKEGSVGLPLSNEIIKIHEPDDKGEGEICVKGPNVMLGYYKDQEATEAAFDEDGYFRTGDAGRLDGDGFLYITGRLKNLIILSNGKNVYPEEIEAELTTVPGVSEVVVYEGVSARGLAYNTIVAEIFPSEDFLKENQIEDAYAYFHKFVLDYNRTAVPYKKIGLLKIRTEDFPKNTLRKIVRFKIDKNID